MDARRGCRCLLYTSSPGGDPSLVIPEDINTIVTTQGSPAEVRWSTNIIYKNSTDIVPPVDTDFTVKLYEGELDAQALSGGAQPVKTYRNSAENNLRNVTSFAIPAADIPKISKGNVPSYTVTVQVKHPLNDSILTATAYILVNSPAAVVAVSYTHLFPGGKAGLRPAGVSLRDGAVQR